MPKLVINAGGDEFFLPDDTRFWWDEMSDEKVTAVMYSLATFNHADDRVALQHRIS